MRIQEKYGDSLDVARGLFIVTCGPIVLLYCFLSAINQLVRRTHLNPCSQPDIAANSSETNPGIVTVRTKKHLTKMRNWNRSLVFTYAIYWGIAYVVMQIFVSQMTVVFLSWMIEETATMGLAPVTLIMMGVGATMFLLPPVPGVPVYFTLGIVLTAQGKDALGYTGSIFYSTAIGLILKLLASAMQQKMIGENLSRFVTIRQLVGINSILMKAMRLVLSKNGLDVAKVAVLIGGPGACYSNYDMYLSSFPIPLTTKSLNRLANICALRHNEVGVIPDHAWNSAGCLFNIPHVPHRRTPVHGCARQCYGQSNVPLGRHGVNSDRESHGICAIWQHVHGRFLPRANCG